MVRIRKQILAPGVYVTRMGPVRFTPQDIREFYRTGKAMLRENLAASIPLDHQRDAGPEERSSAQKLADGVGHNTGWVSDFSISKSGALWADLDVEWLPGSTDDKEIRHRLEKTIKYVSPQIRPEYQDGKGRVWKNAITHVALTVAPVDAGQQPFGVTNFSLVEALRPGVSWSPNSKTVCLSLADLCYGDQEIEMAVVHAPPKGITVNGKQFKGGQFIPKQDLANATPEEIAAFKKAEEGKDARSKAIRDAVGTPDRKKLDDLFAKQVSIPNLEPDEAAAAKRTWISMKGYHGEDAEHRLHQLITTEVGKLEKATNPKERDRLLKRLSGLRMMLDWHAATPQKPVKAKKAKPVADVSSVNKPKVEVKGSFDFEPIEEEEKKPFDFEPIEEEVKVEDKAEKTAPPPKAETPPVTPAAPAPIMTGESIISTLKDKPQFKGKNTDWEKLGIAGNFARKTAPAASIDKLIKSGDIRLHQPVDDDMVVKIMKAVKNGGQYAPVVITNEPGKKMLVVNGANSLAAAIRNGDKVDVVVADSITDAIPDLADRDNSLPAAKKVAKSPVVKTAETPGAIPVEKGKSGGVKSPLDTYFHEIDKKPLLSAEEEKDLAARAKSGDKSARDAMVSANLRLAAKIAKRYAGRGVDLQDLIAEGNIGLFNAIDGFDPEKGRFSTYATYGIEQAIRRAIQNSGKTIRMPVHMAESITKWRRAAAQLQEELGRPPTPEEIKNKTGFSEKKAAGVQNAMRIAATQSASDKSEDGPSKSETLADERVESPESGLLKAEDRQQVQDMIAKMEPREAAVIRKRFGLDNEKPKTLEEIGKELGLTKERVRQIESETLAKLREKVKGGSDKKVAAKPVPVAPMPAAAQPVHPVNKTEATAPVNSTVKGKADDGSSQSKNKKAVARERIDRTKLLNLDQRREVVQDAITSLGIKEWDNSHSPKLKKWLEANGYEPVMFTNAFRLWLSGNRGPASKTEATAPVKEFHDEVQEIAHALPQTQSSPQSRGARVGDKKVFISHIWDEYKKRHPEETRESFNKKMWEGLNKGHLDLTRADYVEAMHPQDVSESQIAHPAGKDVATFNFLSPRKKEADSTGGSKSPKNAGELQREVDQLKWASEGGTGLTAQTAESNRRTLQQDLNNVEAWYEHRRKEKEKSEKPKDEGGSQALPKAPHEMTREEYDAAYKRLKELHDKYGSKVFKQMDLNSRGIPDAMSVAAASDFDGKELHSPDKLRRMLLHNAEVNKKPLSESAKKELTDLRASEEAAANKPKTREEFSGELYDSEVAPLKRQLEKAKGVAKTKLKKELEDTIKWHKEQVEKAYPSGSVSPVNKAETPPVASKADGASSEPWHGNREEVHAAMRDLGAKLDREYASLEKMRAPAGTISVGGADFDHTLKATVIQEYLSAIRKGKTPEEALAAAKQAGDESVKKWNTQGIKGRVSINNKNELKRWEGAGSASAEDVHRSFMNAIKPRDAASAPTPPVPEAPKEKRLTPAKGTPERDALEQAAKSQDDKETEIHDMMSEVQSKIDNSRSPYSKVVQTLKAKKAKLGEQLAKLKQDGADARRKSRIASLEDIIDNGDDAQRLAAQAILKERGGAHYKEIEKLARAEAKRQGVPEEDIKSIAGDAANMISNYPGNSSLQKQIATSHRVMKQQRGTMEGHEELNKLTNLESHEKEVFKKKLNQSYGPEETKIVLEEARKKAKENKDIADRVAAKEKEENEGMRQQMAFSPDVKSVKVNVPKSAGLAKFLMKDRRTAQEKKQGIKDPMKLSPDWVGTAQDTGWGTNGVFMMKLPKKEHEALKGRTGNGNRRLSIGAIEGVAKTPHRETPAKILGARLHERDDGSPKYLVGDDKAKAIVNGDYVATIKDRYPNATIHMPVKKNGPVVFRDGGNVVGVVMPIGSGNKGNYTDPDAAIVTERQSLNKTDKSELSLQSNVTSRQIPFSVNVVDTMLSLTGTPSKGKSKPMADEELFTDEDVIGDGDGDEVVEETAEEMPMPDEVAPDDQMGDDNEGGLMAKASETAAGLGIMVDAAVCEDPEDWIKHFITAANTHKTTKDMAKADSEPNLTNEPEGESMPEPQMVAMSLRMQKLEAELAKSKAADLLGDLNFIQKTMPFVLSKEEADNYKKAITTKQLSLVDDTAKELSDIKAQIGALKKAAIAYAKKGGLQETQVSLSLNSAPVDPPNGMWEETEEQKEEGMKKAQEFMMGLAGV